MSAGSRLAGRRALVTGAAHGIGQGIAERFGRDGAAVGIVDVDGEALASAARMLAEQGVTVAAEVADLRDEAQVERAVLECEASLGGLDIVVANAGVEPPEDDRADRLDLAIWQRVIDTNLTGMFLTAKHGLRALLRSDAPDRVLLCTLSPTGVRGAARGQDAYSASKAGVIGLMRVLAADYAPDGIRVNGVMPGFTETRANLPILDDPQMLEEALATIPLGRVGRPSEVAALMSWAASAEASYVTGASLVVDGGQTAV